MEINKKICIGLSLMLFLIFLEILGVVVLNDVSSNTVTVYYIIITVFLGMSIIFTGYHMYRGDRQENIF